MNKQMEKLEKVKKSCKITRRIVNVLFGVLVALLLFCVAAVIFCGVNAGTINSEFQSREDHEQIVQEFSKFDQGIDTGNSVSLYEFDVQDMLESGNISIVVVVYCLYAAFIVAFMAFIFWLISRTFAVIEKSETPFTEEVLKKLKGIFIAFFVCTFFMTGVGPAVIIGLTLWSVYNILDYGMILQTEVDETL